MSFEEKNFKSVQPFRFWCQKVLPQVYDDSLSYYELLCKVVNQINVLTENNNILTDGYNELVEYVNTYFDELDIDEEINDKLDEMANDGTLTRLITPIVINAITVEFAENIAGMTNRSKLYVNLENGNLYFYNGTEWVNTGITYGDTPYYNQGFLMFAGASTTPTYNYENNVLTIPQNTRIVSSHYEYALTKEHIVPLINFRGSSYGCIIFDVVNEEFKILMWDQIRENENYIYIGTFFIRASHKQFQINLNGWVINNELSAGLKRTSSAGPQIDWSTKTLYFTSTYYSTLEHYVNLSDKSIVLEPKEGYNYYTGYIVYSVEKDLLNLFNGIDEIPRDYKIIGYYWLNPQNIGMSKVILNDIGVVESKSNPLTQQYNQYNFITYFNLYVYYGENEIALKNLGTSVVGEPNNFAINLDDNGNLLTIPNYNNRALIIYKEGRELKYCDYNNYFTTIPPYTPIIGYVFRNRVYINGAKIIETGNIPSTKYKAFSCAIFGDSITAGSGTPFPYHYFVSLYGDFICYNYAISGTGYLTEASYNAYTGTGNIGRGELTQQTGNNTFLDIIKKYKNDITPDKAIVIFGGTNDFSKNVSLEDFENKVDETIKYCIDNFVSPIILCSICHRAASKNSQNKTIEDYNNIINKIADKYNVGFIDLFKAPLYCTTGITTPERRELTMPDGVHPIAFGASLLASYFNAEMKKYLPVF